jgi:hypothetical protein
MHPKIKPFFTYSTLSLILLFGNLNRRKRCNKNKNRSRIYVSHMGSLKCLKILPPSSFLFPSKRVDTRHPYAQSTYIYRAPQCMSPRWNWDSSTPLAASECALPPGPKGGGRAHSPAAKGVGESQFQRLENA